MNKFDLVVLHYVTVKVNKDKFTPEFMEEFRDSFYPFFTLKDHVNHLAQLYARGIVDEFTDFIEGYGDPKDFGIEFIDGDVAVDDDYV